MSGSAVTDLIIFRPGKGVGCTYQDEKCSEMFCVGGGVLIGE